MTILRIVKRSIDREMYDAIIERLDIDHQHPLGLIMHGASDVDGRIQVAQVWASAEYAQRFDRDVLKPVLEALDAPLKADTVIVELEHLVTP